MTLRSKRQQLIADGLCVNYSRCGRERGADGTKTMCRECAKAKSEKEAKRLSRMRRRKRKDGLCIEDGCRENAYKNRIRCKTHLILAAQANQRHRRKFKLAIDVIPTR